MVFDVSLNLHVRNNAFVYLDESFLNINFKANYGLFYTKK